MTISWDSPRVRVAVVVLLVAGAAAFAVYNRPRPRQMAPGRAASSDTLVIAATGDSAPFTPIPAREGRIGSVSALLGASSIAITNFEATALAAAPQASDEPRWPAASPSAAADLRALGFSAVSLANNHTTDYGLDGLRQTEQQLDAAGLAHAGSGSNLQEARSPVFIETTSGRVALLAVTASHAPIARAAPARGDINGRPGVNPLRYSRRVTADPATFASLKNVVAGSGADRTAISNDRLNLFGTWILRGERTSIELVPDPDDVAELLAAVRRARAEATAVVVSVHAHEPGNLVDAVPDFLRAVAHAAVDAGADLVVGHGPHRLRGIEIYGGRPILYSLGNFIFEDRPLNPEAADLFEDSSHNLLAGVTSAGEEGRATLDFSDDVWWQSVVARATFRGGRFVELELDPIDLGVGEDRATRGLPRLASPAVAAAILSRLQTLSGSAGTTIAIRGGKGFVVPPAR